MSCFTVSEIVIQLYKNVFVIQNEICVYRQTMPSPFFLWSVQVLLYIPQFPRPEAKKRLKISRHTEAVFVVSQATVPAG